MKKYFLLLLLILILASFLRLYKLDSVPIALHGDEIGVGYNAYTLLTEGKDEYGRKFPLKLRADVTPLIFYATIPSIALFGRTDFAIRFPSVVVGLTTILVFYFFIKILLETFINTKFKPIAQEKMALLGTFLLSISPWHVQLSRITHDASYGILIQLLAFISFFKYVTQPRWKWLIGSALLFGVSFYSYHAPRVTSLLFILFLLWVFRAKLSRYKLLVFTFTLVLITVPLVYNFISKPLSQTRFGGISIFVRESENENRLLSVPGKLIYNYAAYLNPVFLFGDSSRTRYFNVKAIGLLFLAGLPFLVVGLGKINQNPNLRNFCLWWCLIAILPGALTLGPPNAGRIAILFPLLEFFVAVGLVTFCTSLSKKLVTTFLIGANCVFFLHQYFLLSPTQFETQWQYGVKEIITFAVANEARFDKIIVDSNIKQAYVYMLFYGQKTPAWLQAVQKKRNPLVGYDAIGKYEFRQISWEEDRGSKVLFIVPSSEIPEETGIYSVLSHTGQPIYKAITTKS